jgi:hypothetical protein
MPKTKWEYLRLESYMQTYDEWRVCLTPHRESNAEALTTLGLKAEAISPRTDPYWFATEGKIPAKNLTQQFWKLVDQMTADGWEPFKVIPTNPLPTFHFRRQTE